MEKKGQNSFILHKDYRLNKGEYARKNGTRNIIRDSKKPHHRNFKRII
jgi:hypothetical protein